MDSLRPRLPHMPTALDDQPYTNGPGTGRRGRDKRPRKRMMPVLGPFSRALRRGAIDNRSREGRFLAATRQRLIQHLGGDPSTTQLVLIDRIAWLMLHCFLLDQRIAAGESWGENDGKCYLAFCNSLVRSLRELGLEGGAGREPTLAEVLKAERVA
jgi:hypothetical protein